MRSRLLMIVGKALGIAMIGAGLGVGINALRADGLALGSGAPVAKDGAGEGGSCAAGPAAKVPEVSPAEAKGLYGQEGVTFVDARSRADYERGHIKGAILLPYETAASVAGQASLPVPTTHRLIVYCEYVDCQLSALLAQLLSQSGCERVRILKGGFPAWAGAGLPVEVGP